MTLPLAITTRLPALRAGRWVEPIELDPRITVTAAYLAGVARRTWRRRPAPHVARPAALGLLCVLGAATAPWWAPLSLAVILAPVLGLGMLAATAVVTGRAGTPPRHRRPVPRLGPVRTLHAYLHTAQHRA